MKKMYEPFNKAYKTSLPELIMNVVGAVSIFAMTYMAWIIICGMGGL